MNYMAYEGTYICKESYMARPEGTQRLRWKSMEIPKKI